MPVETSVKSLLYRSAVARLDRLRHCFNQFQHTRSPRKLKQRGVKFSNGVCCLSARELPDDQLAMLRNSACRKHLVNLQIVRVVSTLSAHRR